MNQRLKLRSQYYYIAEKSYHCENNSQTPEIVRCICFGQYHPYEKETVVSIEYFSDIQNLLGLHILK